MLPLYAGVFLVSAAALFFEITLTRLFSVAQWYHFAFISVSVALLGFGASGTWLALHPPANEQQSITGRLANISVFFSLSVLVAYLAINYVPFDSYRIALERKQLLYLGLYYMGLILPFFFAGLCVGVPLSTWPGRANAVYAANLAGSAAGSLAVLVAMPILGGTGAVICAGALGAMAAITFAFGHSDPGRSSTHTRSARVAYLVLFAGWAVLLVCRPTFLNLRLSPYKALSRVLLFPDTRLTSSRWNAFSRVDVVESTSIHSAPGLSLSFAGDLPEQSGLLVDAGNLSPITCLQAPGEERFLQHLPSALPFMLRPGARALLIEPRGGLDILTALHNGASGVVAVESNPLVVSAVSEELTSCRADAYGDERVTVVFEDARSYLRRSADRFDVVVVCLSDSYEPVISGAYGLSESYLYTVEAVRDYLQHLKDDGILVVTRWVQAPPSEELRACLLLAEAFQQSGGDPARQVIAFRSWSTATLLAKRTPFRAEEISAVKAFCDQRSFDLIYYEGMPVTEANRFNKLPDTAHYDTFKRVLSGDGQRDFLRRYPYDISPPSDDRPFFYHYFKWEQTPQILRILGKTWQPFGGSGFLVLVVLLALALVLSLLLILLPLVVLGRGTARPESRVMHGPGALKWTLLYFAALGLGFLFVEMPLLQQFILFLGQPTYSFSLVLFSVLLFSGLGSMLSVKLRVRSLLLALVAVVLVYPLLLPRLFALSMGTSLPVRLLVAALSLGPLGFLLGVPLPSGIRLLEQSAPGLIPWAWAVNGCISVISSILAVLGAVSAGSSLVLVAGALAYLIAWVAAAPLSRLAARVTL